MSDAAYKLHKTIMFIEEQRRNKLVRFPRDETVLYYYEKIKYRVDFGFGDSRAVPLTLAHLGAQLGISSRGYGNTASSSPSQESQSASSSSLAIVRSVSITYEQNRNFSAEKDLLFYLVDAETIRCGSPYSLTRHGLHELTEEQCQAVLEYLYPFVQVVAQEVALVKLLAHLGHEELRQLEIDL